MNKNMAFCTDYNWMKHSKTSHQKIKVKEVFESML